MAKKKTEKKSTLIITEKPQAAAKIAHALSNGTDEKHTNKQKVSYYEFGKNNKNYLVGCAVGHLLGLQQIPKRSKFPNFEIAWKPNYERKNGAYTKKYYNQLKKLAKQADEFIVATDYDVEGEVIGWNVVRFIAKQDNAKRMKFSSLTQQELEKSFNNLSNEIDWGQAIAGETRHYLDWYYGINLSRGLMKALSKTGSFRILSIGRVQGPALKIIVDKEKQIQKFKPTPYWNVYLQIQDINNNKLEVEHPKNIEKESELLKFKQLKGKKAQAQTKVKLKKDKPLPPFNLTNLQTEAYRWYKITPKQSMAIAQKLYLSGLISYPRTSSQKLPQEIGYDKILKQLSKQTKLTKYALNKTPVEGKKSDPAHPAIYPTGEFKKLTGQTKKLYDLIVKRFIACFCNPAEIENKKLTLEVNNLKFKASGIQIKEKNWLAVYPKKIKESKIPTINGEVDIKEIRIEEKQTKPPNRYTPASLVRELEKRDLGTKATRTNIVETLYSRGYVKNQSLEATPLGMKMIQTLEQHSPIILNEELTRNMEKEMEALQESDKKSELEKTEKKIIEKSKEQILKIAKDLKENEDKIGKDLQEATHKVYEQQAKDNTLTQCPVCKKGNLRIMYGRRYKRYFISCNNYPKCKTIYSLPPKGVMKPAKIKDDKGEETFDLCPECSFPMILSLKKGKRPWKFCFNPACPTNEEWVKKKQEYKEKMQKENQEKTKTKKKSKKTKKKKSKK